MASRASDADGPRDLVTVGHVLDSWRLDGSIKVVPYSQDAAALLAVREWWFEKDGALRAIDVVTAKRHGESVTARLVGVVDRDAALALKGARIAIPRSRFPVTDDDEYYWVDLIGLAVVNQAGEPMGVVAELLDNGAHQNLVVAAAGERNARLIPFVDAYVKSVDLATRRIVVDWQADY